MSAEDEELISTLSEDKPSKRKGSNKKQRKEEPSKKSIQKEGTLDPRDEFLDILRDIGLKRGVEVMADVFYSGDINNPEWLDQTLSLGGISIPQRRLIITRYYGESPEDIGIELLPSMKTHKQKEKQEEDEDVSLKKLKQTQAQLLRDRFEAANIKAMLKDLEKGDETEKPKKIIERPLIKEGEIVMKDGVPVMEKIIVHGDDYQSGSDITSVLAMIKMMSDGKNQDPNAKPSWAIELENQIKQNKAEEDKKRLELELLREREKKEELEKEYKRELERAREEYRRELERMRDEHSKDMDKFSSEMDFRLKAIEDTYNADLRHREQMDAIQAAYGEKFESLKEQLEMNQKDIKSAVITEITKTGSKIAGSATNTVEGIITPMAEVAKEMYKTQIEMMRQQHGLVGNNTVPETTEDELKELM